MYCVIWSGASGQVSHAFLSIANICQFLYHFIMLLLLCITPQHIYVVVVVYYTTGTIQLQNSEKLIMWSLLSNIQRPIVMQKIHIYIPIVEKINFIGLLFLFIETKELCEARGEAKHEKLMIIPPI